MTTDPTNKYKNKLINLLKTIKAEGGIDNNTYKRLYPTGEVPPKYYGLPKIHKQGTPLRPIISSRGSVSYETAKELAMILKPLIGKSPHHVYNNKDFLESIKDIKVEDDECIMIYDVTTLFTSIPIDTTINIIKKQLEEDRDLKSRTNMTIKHICCLLEFCLKNTYFKFTGEFYAQQEEVAMGSPISPVVANLFMEDLEIKAIRTSNTPPKIWRRYVDDTCTIIKEENRNIFLQHLNSIHPNIKFTCEEMKEDGSMPFLDILIIPTEHGSLKTSVFRKHTHTDLYLQWDSHHNIPSKYSVADTLYHRANTICSDPTVLHEEEKHLFKALRKCKYPIWAIHRAKLKSQNPNRTKHRRTNNQKGPSNTKNQKLYMLVPYHQGLSKKVKNHAANMGYRYILMEDKPSKASSWLLRRMIPLIARVESYTDINAKTKGVEKNTLENLAEPLQKGSKSIKSPLHQYLTTVTPQVIISTSTNLLYWEGKTRMSQEQLKRQYL